MPDRSRVPRRWHEVSLAILACALYANTLGHGYVLDDAVVVSRNEFVQRGLAGVPDILSSDSFHGLLGEDARHLAGGRYRPLSLLTFALEVEILGEARPAVSHAINVLLYAFCCVFLYRAFASALSARAPPAPGTVELAWLAALLFAAHPIHTEVVANVKGRDEILALIGGLATIAAAWRALSRPGRSAQVLCGLAFFAALLAKENAITALAVVPAALWFFRSDFRTGLRRVMPPLLIAAGVYLLLRQAVIGPTSGGSELLNDPFLGMTSLEAYATVFYTLALYAKLLVWPDPLTHDYAPYHIPIVSPDDPRAWAGLVGMLAIAALALVGWRRRWLVSFAAVSYLATLSIVSNFFVSIGTFMGERFLFLPSAPACLGLAWVLRAGCARAFPGAARAAGIAVAAIVLALFSAQSVARNPVWKDGFTLFTTDVQTSARSAHATTNAAEVLTVRARETSDPAERDRLTREAIAHLETALEVHPEHRRALGMLAKTWQELAGDPERAFATYERLFEVNPQQPNVAYNLGTLLLVHHPERSEEALRYLAIALRQEPDDPDALANLGIAYYRRGELDAAIRSLERAVALAPEHATHRRNLEKLREERRAAGGQE